MKPQTLIIILFVVLTSALRAEEPKTVTLILSPETTYLTEPRLPDGRIDYLAALNKELAARTTPRNNLLVAVFSLIAGETEEALLRERKTDEDKKGFESLNNYRNRFWKMLGLDAPPPLDSLVESSLVSSSKDFKTYEKELLEFYSKNELNTLLDLQRKKEKEQYKEKLDDKKITQENYDKEIQKIETETPDWYYREIVSDQWTEARKRPWTAKEFPYLAHWIATTDDWTPKLIDICRNRTGYYHPLLCYDENSSLCYDAVLPYVQSFRSASLFFQMRGNWEFTQGRIDPAMECAFASVRMGWTIRKGASTIVEELIGISMIGCGHNQLTTYLTDLPKEKDAAWILQKKKEYDAIATEIGPLPWLPIWCRAERFGAISIIQAIPLEPNKVRELFKMSYADENKEFAANVERLFFSGKEYDWNEIMKLTNVCHDEIEDIYLLPGWPRRFRAAQRFEQRIAEEAKRSDDPKEKPERRAAAFLFENYVVPSVEPVMIALTRSEWDTKITSVAFALAAYRADHGGENPDTLEQLVPKYLDKIPESPFTEKPLRYLKRAHDVLIANDDEYKLDGSEPDVEKKIAEAQSGGRAFPAARHFIFIVQKTN